VNDIDLIGDVIERQMQPRPITVTAKNPRTELTTDNKRRMFANLHKQLGEELEKAKKLGTLQQMDQKLMGDAVGYYGRPADEWEDLDMEMMESWIREIVRGLISKRQELVRYGSNKLE
jgi:hypothetical protein